jgi:F-type H+-transporting ATPase subunit alpha
VSIVELDLDFLMADLRDEELLASSSYSVGQVIMVGDGIARVSGLAEVMAGEMVYFPRSNISGLALNLEADAVGIVLFGSDSSILEGDLVNTTGEVMSVSVGDALLGTVLDALGQPLLGELPADLIKKKVEAKAPGIIARRSVYEPVHTGIKAIDSLLPIGRGQRELIIGDRQTGKTALAVDAIIAQRNYQEIADENERLACIYVAIGQKQSTVYQILQTLQRERAFSYTCIVRRQHQMLLRCNF